MTAELKQYIDERFDRIERTTLLGAKEVLTVEEAAMLTGYAVKGIYQLTSEKRIPHYKKNGRLYFRKSELDAWLTEDRVLTKKEIAQRHCVQVDYELHGKRYYAVGFPNNANGLELRNPFFKGSYPPKHITLIANGNARCNVFEGFIDFLSAERLGLNDGLTLWFSIPLPMSAKR